MAEGRLTGVEVLEFRVVSKVVAPGHHFDAGGSAQWLRIAVCKLHAVGGESVEVWSFIGCAAVSAEAFDAHIVSHD